MWSSTESFLWLLSPLGAMSHLLTVAEWVIPMVRHLYRCSEIRALIALLESVVGGIT